MAAPAPDPLEAKRLRLQELRQRREESARAFDAWFDVELTWSSNAIEGGTLSRIETALVIEKGLTVGGKPLRDHLEAIGHHEAIGYVRALAAEERPIGEGDMRAIHQLVMGRSRPDESGRYAMADRFIQGSSVRFPPAPAIPGLMAALASWLDEAPLSPETAFEAHVRLVAIHPFNDGNGRTARLLMNLLLLRQGYPPVVIGPDLRLAYLTALERRSADGDAEPYRALLRVQLEASLDRHIEELARNAGTAADA